MTFHSLCPGIVLDMTHVRIYPSGTSLTILRPCHYLNKREVNDKGESATKYGVCTKFCTMPHAVMPSISRYHHLSQFLQFDHHLVLVGLPEQMNSRKQFLLLEKT